MDALQPQNPPENPNLSRTDFLKALGLAGLGIAGASTMMSTPASAEEGKKPKYCFVVTNGSNNPNRAIWSLAVADAILSKDVGTVHVWFTLEGTDLCRKGHAEKVISPIFQKSGNALEILERVKKAGATFGVCPPCADWFGAKDADKLEYVELQGGDVLGKILQESIAVWM